MNALTEFSSKFSPPFGHDDACIKIEYLLGAMKRTKILKLSFQSWEDFFSCFMEVFFDLICEWFWKKYLDNTLDADEIRVIKDSIHNPDFNLHVFNQNVYGIVAETILRSFRWLSTIRHYVNDEINTLKTPTHSWPDLVELIEEWAEYFMILWDSRNNLRDKDIKNAILGKIKSLASKDWRPSPLKLKELNLWGIYDHVYEIYLSWSLNYDKVIAVVSWVDIEPSEIEWNASYISWEIASLEGKSILAKDEEWELENLKYIQAIWNYEYSYVMLVVPWYEVICKRLFNCIKNFPIRCNE